MNLETTKLFESNIDEISLADLTCDYLLENKYITKAELEIALYFVGDYCLENVNRIVAYSTGYKDLEELTMESDHFFYEKIIKEYC